MATNPGLDARLLVRTDNAVFGRQRPKTRIQIKDHFRFGDELRVAGEDPVLKTPRLQVGGVQDPPDGGPADRSPSIS
jgi:hypothetical protein